MDYLQKIEDIKCALLEHNENEAIDAVDNAIAMSSTATELLMSVGYIVKNVLLKEKYFYIRQDAVLFLNFLKRNGIFIS